MNIGEACKNGIKYLRLPTWNEKAYIEITILEDGRHGPWVKLFDPYATNEPIDLLWYSVDSNDFEEFRKT